MMNNSLNKYVILLFFSLSEISKQKINSPYQWYWESTTLRLNDTRGVDYSPPPMNNLAILFRHALLFLLPFFKKR